MTNVEFDLTGLDAGELGALTWFTIASAARHFAHSPGMAAVFADLHHQILISEFERRQRGSMSRSIWLGSLGRYASTPELKSLLTNVNSEGADALAAGSAAGAMYWQSVSASLALELHRRGEKIFIAVDRQQFERIENERLEEMLEIPDPRPDDGDDKD